MRLSGKGGMVVKVIRTPRIAVNPERHVPLTDAGKLVPGQEVNDACTAERGAEGHHPGVTGDHAADLERSRSQWVRAQRRQHTLGVAGGDEGEQDALVGYIKGVEPEHFARSAYVVRHGNHSLVDFDTDPGCRGDLVERARHAAARWIA